MPSFPLMRDLPPVVETTGWDWRSFEAPVARSMNFWLGTDREGNRWLTKLTGDFYAYREIVFARLAQQMGWSCQSSVFMRLDERSAKAIDAKPGEVHAAHWFLDEHVHPPCDQSCNLAPLIGRPVGVAEDLADLPIAHILDWPKSELAACLFGGNEPPGRLFTKEHEFVIIDSELMFATGPCSFDSTRWWGDRDTPTPSGVKLAKEVCADLLALGQSSLEAALALPADINVQERWPITPLLYESYAHAQAFIGGTHGA
ncbi:MAG: hypothetical protein FD135_3588 [Comamonadaceae bacterium]|nr:MAG: hypothetical protein FD135_3588 [Comamonadaceae bacterium]